MNIFVGNLSHLVTQKDIETAFSQYGTVESVTITPDLYADIRQARDSQRGTNAAARSYCYVEMPVSGEALAAMNALNGSTLKGRRINVIQALPLKSKGRKEIQRRPFTPDSTPPQN